MSSTLEERATKAAARARQRLDAGANVDDVLRTFREEDDLGPLGSILALRGIAPIGLDAAKVLVSEACDGKSFTHLGLADLQKLADCGSLPGSWLRLHLRHALLEHRPWLLLVPGGTECVTFYQSSQPDPALAGSTSGPGVSFTALVEEIRALATHPRWAGLVELLRDEPSALLVHFPTVPQP